MCKNKPSKEEVLKFLQVVDNLCSFEASNRSIRGYGIFKDSELPVPEVVSVIGWLEEEFSIGPGEVRDIADPSH